MLDLYGFHLVENIWGNIDAMILMKWTHALNVMAKVSLKYVMNVERHMKKNVRIINLRAAIRACEREEYS